LEILTEDIDETKPIYERKDEIKVVGFKWWFEFNPLENLY